MRAWRCNTPFGKIRLSVEPPQKCPAHFGDGPHSCITHKGKRRAAAEEIESKKCDAEEVEVLPAAEHEAREAAIYRAISAIEPFRAPHLVKNADYSELYKAQADLEAAKGEDGDGIR